MSLKTCLNSWTTIPVVPTYEGHVEEITVRQETTHNKSLHIRISSVNFLNYKKHLLTDVMFDI